MQKIRYEIVDITIRPTSHRTAVVQAIIKVSKQETIDAINNKTVPKGDYLKPAVWRDFLL